MRKKETQKCYVFLEIELVFNICRILIQHKSVRQLRLKVSDIEGFEI